MKILLAEDDPALVSVVEKILSKENHEVTVASDGLAAKSILALDKFDLILSDIKMPNLNGIELLHFVKKNLKTPVILMTGFSEVCETKEASDLGAAHFLSKPFTRSELIGALAKVGPAAAPVIEEDQDYQYTGLRIEEFVTGKEINFDIFIRLSAVKFVKIASRGESIDISRILSYRSRGVSHLYLTKGDFSQYLSFTSNLAQLVSNSEKIEHSRKVQFLVQTSMSVMKKLYLDKVDIELFNMATELSGTTIDLLSQSVDMLKLFEMFKSHSDSEYSHSLAVSVYSVLIAKALGWKSPRTLVHLSMCGMLHDIGKKELPTELLAKSRTSMNSTEIALYETHPIRGMEILSRIKGLPEDAAMVAMQHHENCQGTGYPHRLGKNHIMPFSKVVGLANEFCRLALPGPEYDGMDAISALRKLSSLGAERFDSTFLEGLSTVIYGQAKFGSSS